jgi:hypothetical protein
VTPLAARESFDAALPLHVTAGTVNGTARTGAGTLENQAAEESYRFRVARRGSSLFVELSACPGTYAPTWSLVDEATGRPVTTGLCGGYRTGALPAGDYRLDVDQGTPRHAGSYVLDAFAVPPPDTFDVTLPLTVADGTVNGTAATGAGRLETKASADAYRITVPTGGQVLSVEPSACPATAYLQWEFVDAAGRRLADGLCSFTSAGLVPAGTYRLLVTPLDGRTGTYRLSVRAAEAFTATLPLTVSDGVVNGTPAAGAGRLEAAGAQDVYRFTVPAGMESLAVGRVACPGGGYLWWELTEETTGRQVRQGGCSLTEVRVTAGTTYQLAVSPLAGAPRELPARLQPAQTFTGALPLTITDGRVNGVATAGAGRLETTASRDVFTFTGPSGGRRVGVGPSLCVDTYYLDWAVVDDVSGKQQRAADRVRRARQRRRRARRGAVGGAGVGGRPPVPGRRGRAAADGAPDQLPGDVLPAVVADRRRDWRIGRPRHCTQRNLQPLRVGWFRVVVAPDGSHLGTYALSVTPT